MARTDQEIQTVAVLLRQLWLGLSSYRLYPGSPDRPGFTAAVERISGAALEALVPGPVDLEIRGDQFFLLDGAPVPADDSARRFALACFERQVERLTLSAVPSADDLDKLYGVLSTPAHQLVVAGGADEVLRNDGVVSVSLSPMGPPKVEGADHVTDDLPSGRPNGGVGLGPSLPADEDLASPGEQAESLLAHLRAIAGGRDPDAELAASTGSAAVDPTSGLRPSVVEALVDRMRDDPMTRRLIGAMNNAELTRTLVNLGEVGGGDPVELAEALAAAGVRHVDVVDLTEALRAGREEAGTIIAGLEQLGIDVSLPAAGSSPGSVTQALSDYLVATRSDDIRAMQAAMAQAQSENRSSALLALRDYLTLEVELERVGEVLDVWAGELKEAVRRADAHRIRALLPPIRGALSGTGDDRNTLFEMYTRQSLDRESVSELLAAEGASGGSPSEEVLLPFGDLGVDVLLDLLAEEEDRDKRARLFGVLRRIVPNHARTVVHRLKDPRWYVVRNAVALLGAAGGAENLERLAVSARHASPEVRKEATAALAAAGGTAAVPLLRRLLDESPEDTGPAVVLALGTLAGPEAGAALADVVVNSNDRAVRELALDRLALRSGGRELLLQLGSRRSPSRLPWRLRRRARKLAAQMGSVQR